MTYPKFKEGKARENGPKVSSDYGIYQYQPYYLSQKLTKDKLKRMQWLNIRNAKKWRQ